jgi:hypothetical protein
MAWDTILRFSEEGLPKQFFLDFVSLKFEFRNFKFSDQVRIASDEARGKYISYILEREKIELWLFYLLAVYEKSGWRTCEPVIDCVT